MVPRMRVMVPLAAWVLALAVLVGCTQPAATRSVRGVLLEVRAGSIDKLDSFVLRTDAGEELSFTASPDFNRGATHAMSPGHMRQHMALAEHVTVSYRDD